MTTRFNGDYDLGDVDDILSLGRWTARRNKVLNGRPGRKALRELERALLMMPHKELITGGLCDGTRVCVVGAWLYRSYVDGGMTPKDAWTKLQEGKPRRGDWSSWEELGRTRDMGTAELGVTRTLVEVLAFVNDEEAGYFNHVTPEILFQRLLDWVRQHMATDAEVAV